jgi:hypothetical protein
MANTYTPTYNLIQPEVGADTNAWGTHVNTDLSTIDTHMLSRALTTSQTAAGPMVFGQTLRVNGAVTFDSTLLVTGNTTLAGTSAHTGAATFASTLAVTGTTTLGAVNVSGAAAFSGAVTVQTPSASANPTTKAYVDAADALKLNLSGGTISGGLTIQNTAPTITMADTDNGTFSIHCNSALIGFLGTGGGWISRTDNSGNFVATGNVTAYSDAKLKENVKTIENAVDLVNQMRGVYYDRIDTGEAGVGVIAQELREIVPEVVKDNDGTLSVAYGNLVGVLIEAVKELSNKVAALEATK